MYGVFWIQPEMRIQASVGVACMILMVLAVMRCGVFVLLCTIMLCMPIDSTAVVMVVMVVMVFKKGPFAK